MYGWCLDTSEYIVEDHGVTPKHPDKGTITSTAYGFLDAAIFVRSIKQEKLNECEITLITENKAIATRMNMLTWNPPSIKVAMKPGSDVALAVINTFKPAKIKCIFHQGEEDIPNPRCIHKAFLQSQHNDNIIQQPSAFKPITPRGPYIYT